ncbi:MAG: hypothetical protein HLUCCA12_00005, partial [Rhodobacteraceae bacterium HLUCCA12]
MPDRDDENRNENLEDLAAPYIGTWPGDPDGEPDGVVHGTDDADRIDAAYVDAQGDQVDNASQVWPGRD